MADRCSDMSAVDILKATQLRTKTYGANADGSAYWHNLANTREPIAGVSYGVRGLSAPKYYNTNEFLQRAQRSHCKRCISYFNSK